MLPVAETGSQGQLSSGGRSPAARGGRSASAAPLNQGLRRLVLCMSVVGGSLLSAAGVAVSQEAAPSM
jgi:hypothetical protein